jgi:DNA polymerase III alpha subunit
MLPDIDIDFSHRFQPDKVFPEAVPASMVKNDLLVRHNVGQYFQKMARDKVTGFAAIPYEEAEVLGYFKVDFLKIGPLDCIESKQELRELIKQEPDWDILKDEKEVPKLFHIGKHYKLLQELNPHSVDDLADVLALVRPGKKHLINAYMQNKEAIRKELYDKSEDYCLKKSHAIAYALTIVMQMHLVSRGQL